MCNNQKIGTGCVQTHLPSCFSSEPMDDSGRQFAACSGLVYPEQPENYSHLQKVVSENEKKRARERERNKVAVIRKDNESDRGNQSQTRELLN